MTQITKAEFFTTAAKLAEGTRMMLGDILSGSPETPELYLESVESRMKDLTNEDYPPSVGIEAARVMVGAAVALRDIYAAAPAWEDEVSDVEAMLPLLRLAAMVKGN